MNSGLGGSAGYGENSFKTNGVDVGNLDDGAVWVDVSSVFGAGLDVGGSNYTSFYINSNGSITFGGSETHWSETLYTANDPMIAPFLTDVDLSKGGDIYWDLDPASGTVTITWDGVAPYSGSGANSFQLVLTDAGDGDFNVEFIYEDIQYTSGSGTTATAGFADGSGGETPLDGSGNATTLSNYETHDFGSVSNGTYQGHYSDGEQGDGWLGPADGTSGDDVMGDGYVDAEGHFIGSGDDEIYGGAGDDTIDGGAGSDTIYGGAGDDILSGGANGPGITWTDVASGGNFTGTSSQDFFRWTATTGASSLIRLNNSAGAADGDGEADYILVETTNATGTLTIGDFEVGTDKIVLQENYTGISASSFGSGTSVTLTYSNGNQQSFDIYHQEPWDASQVFTLDVPSLPNDADTLDGGDDADTFIVEDDFGDDIIIGGEGGNDDDTVDLSALSTGVTVTYSGDEAGTITDGTDTITFYDIEQIVGTEQADVIDASADSSGVEIDGGQGDDVITGGSGDDTLTGGAGDDTLTGGAGDDTLIAGGNSGSGDELYGGAGDDTLTDSFGVAILDGGDDDDFFNVGYGTATISGGEGGTDFDTLSFAEADDTADITLTSDGAGNYTDDDGDSGSFTGIEAFELTTGGDTLDASSDSSGITVDAGAGDDIITGGSGDDTIEGGTGSDTLTGGAGADTFIYQAGDGHATITDFNTGNTGSLSDGDSGNNDFIDLSAYYDDIWELQADQADDGILNQSNDGVGGADYSDNTLFGAGDSLTFTGATGDGSFFTVENTGVVCFTAGTLIRTIHGERPIETLRPGDKIITRDNGPQELQWISHRTIRQNELSRSPNLKPILVSNNLIGSFAPLLVSRQHGLVLKLDGEEKLIRAIHLARMKGGMARIAQGCRSVTYVHLLFEAHQIIYANGAPSESFYPGAQALGALSPAAKREIAQILPDLTQYTPAMVYGTHARSWAPASELPSRLRALACA